MTVPEGFGELSITENLGGIVNLPEGSQQNGEPVRMGQVQLYVCLRCSAVIADPPTHDLLCPAYAPPLWTPDAR